MMLRKWLTPDELPSGVIHLCVSLPNDVQWRAAIVGALVPLTYESKWEQYGAVAPAAAAAYFEEWLSTFLSGGECMGVPVGTVIDYAGDAEPDGWLTCDGRVLSIAEYAELYAVIGNRYGGDGVTDFALPNCGGRVTVGNGGAFVVGDIGGEASVQLKPAHLPTLTLHEHALPARVIDAGTQQTAARAASEMVVGGNVAHNNMQPYIVMRKLIRAR